MGKMKIILLAALILVATLSAISYAYGWPMKLEAPESSAPTLQEPTQGYG